jgi:Penicillin-insensitive murein endopeptidase
MGFRRFRSRFAGAVLAAALVSPFVSPTSASAEAAVWPVVEYTMAGPVAEALEHLVFDWSGGNWGYTNFNGRYDEPEVNFINSLLSYWGYAVDGIYDARFWGMFQDTNLGSRPHGIWAAKRLLQSAGYSVYHQDMYAWTYADVVSMTNFKSHRGLPANSTIDVNAWFELMRHYQKASNGTTVGVCYGPGEADKWGMPYAVAELAQAGGFSQQFSLPMYAVTAISNEHGSTPGHLSHQQGLDFDIRPTKFGANPCTTAFDIRVTETTDTQNPQTPCQSTPLKAQYDAASTRQLIKNQATVAQVSPWHSFASRVLYNDCAVNMWVNAELNRPEFAIYSAGIATADPLTYYHHWHHWHFSYCVYGRSDYGGFPYRCQGT